MATFILEPVIYVKIRLSHIATPFASANAAHPSNIRPVSRVPQTLLAMLPSTIFWESILNLVAIWWISFVSCSNCQISCSLAIQIGESRRSFGDAISCPVSCHGRSCYGMKEVQQHWHSVGCTLLILHGSLLVILWGFKVYITAWFSLYALCWTCQPNSIYFAI